MQFLLLVKFILLLITIAIESIPIVTSETTIIIAIEFIFIISNKITITVVVEIMINTILETKYNDCGFLSFGILGF